MTTRCIYVTGTDTGIGKTVSSCALIAAARADGLRTAGFKPVASGCVLTAEGWRNDDALSLQAVSEAGVSYDDINPYALPLPQAPEIAARDAGVQVHLDVLVTRARSLQSRVDRLVIEGVGGWAAPFAYGIEQADLARALDAPVILVVGLRLGCMNHARLSARAIQADGLQLAGWIGNRVDVAFTSADENIELLRRDLPAPCLGVLPFADTPVATVFARLLRWPDPI